MPSSFLMSGANSANDIINFSSRGPCTDGRAKPDLCAPGAGVSIINPGGAVDTGSGTSFASPMAAGAAASSSSTTGDR